MASPQQTLTLAPAQVEELARHLSDLRHNINNHLALVTAAVEILRRKPEMAARLVENLAEQPPRILTEVQKFSDHLEVALQINR